MDSPIGELTFDEPAVTQRSPEGPVGELTFNGEVDTRDTDTFAATEDLEAIEEPTEIQTVATQVGELLQPHLEQAEGNRPEVYQGRKDKEGVLTAGIGHKLTASELKKYKEGDSIPPEQVEKWFKQDSKKAVGAAVKQATEIGVESPEFMSALASVNFQLGTNWNKEHKQTWKLMKAGKFKEAAEEAASSTWNDQTPKRVEAFQKALLKLADELEFSEFEDGWYRDKDSKEEFQIKRGRRA